MDLFMRFWTSFAGSLVELLPQSPVIDSEALEALRFYAGYINYFVPVGPYLIFLSGFLGAMGVYNAVLPILRNLKLIK